MKEADVKKIETALGCSLPAEYRSFLIDHSDEVRRIKEMLPLRAVLWSDPKEIIRENKAARKYAHEMVIGKEERPWPKDFLLVGTNGGGDYWFIDTAGALEGIRHWDHETQRISQCCKTFERYLRDLRRDEKEPAKWQPEPIHSSFDASCPLAERFGITLSRECCEIKCQDNDRPVMEKKLQSHGIDVAMVGEYALDLVAILAKSARQKLTIKTIKSSREYPILSLTFAEPRSGDTRYQGVSANIHRGNVFVSLYNALERTPSPKQTGIDWKEFRERTAAVLLSLLPPGTKARISQPKISAYRKAQGRWNYDLTYSLK